MRTYLCNGMLFDGEAPAFGGSVLLADGKIEHVYHEAFVHVQADEIFDAQGMYICPGLLDTHTHGIGGYDFNVLEGMSMEDVTSLEAKEGVTGFFASLVCEEPEDMKRLLRYYETIDIPGFLGIHLEGPFLNPQKKAVMKEDCLRAPSMSEFQDYVSISSKIRSMTIAPELPNAKKLITYGAEHGIVMMLGHTNGTAQDIVYAQIAGAKGVTHLYNAMSQHEHRSPGAVTGAVLSTLYCELICDGVHVHPDVVAATLPMVTPERIVLVSDANPCKGLPKGEYEFSGNTILVDEDQAIVKDSGRIAGSTLRLNEAVKRMTYFSGCEPEIALAMASRQPASLYQLNKGRLKEGYDADIVIMDSDYQVLSTWRNGHCCYQK